VTTLRLYVLREIAAPAFLSVFFFAGVLMIVRLFGYATMVLQSNAGPAVLGELILIIMGTLITLTIPMSVLLGTLIGVGRLTSENEILAMRVSGINVARVFLPMVFAAALVAGSLMWMNSEVIPRLFKRVETIVLRMRLNVINNLSPQVFYDNLGAPGGDFTLYFENRGKAPSGSAGLDMEGINIRIKMSEAELFPGDTDLLTKEERKALEQEREFLIFARRGEIRTTGDDGIGSVDLTLRDGTWIPLEDRESDETVLVRFETLEYSFPTGDEGPKEVHDLDPRHLTTSEILEVLRTKPVVPVIRDDRHGKRIDRR